MATLRDRPYVQFNFLVDLGTGNTDGPDAGFQEVSGIGMEVTVAEYRNGNHKENSVMKITGMNKSTDVTMKRGVIGSLTLYNWLNQIRNGDQNGAAHGHGPAAERGPHRRRDHLEAAAGAHHQAHQRSDERQGHGCGHGRAGAGLRAPGDGVRHPWLWRRRLPGIQFDVVAPPASAAAGADGHCGVRRLRRQRTLANSRGGRGHRPLRGDIRRRSRHRQRSRWRTSRSTRCMPSSVRAFFRNGGTRCWVMRVAGERQPLRIASRCQALLCCKGARRPRRTHMRARREAGLTMSQSAQHCARDALEADQLHQFLRPPPGCG